MKLRKKLIALSALTLSLIMVVPVFADNPVGWQKNETGWWYGTNATGTTWYHDGWQWIDGNKDGISECYYFAPNGYIVTNGKTPDGYDVNAGRAERSNHADGSRSDQADTPQRFQYRLYEFRSGDDLSIYQKACAGVSDDLRCRPVETTHCR